MKIIIGLGNPTREYQATRHNIGFDAVTRLCDDFNIRLDSKEHKALCGKGYIGGEKVILAQPQTFMNLSGESVRALVDYYKLTNEDIIVIYDDIHLDVGQLRVRKKGVQAGIMASKILSRILEQRSLCVSASGSGKNRKNGIWLIMCSGISRRRRSL